MEAAVGVALQFSAGWAMSARSGSAEILMARKILPELFFRGHYTRTNQSLIPTRPGDGILPTQRISRGRDRILATQRIDARPRLDLSYTKNSARLRSDCTYTKNLGRTIVKNQRYSQNIFRAARANFVKNFIRKIMIKQCYI